MVCFQRLSNPQRSGPRLVVPPSRGFRNGAIKTGCLQVFEVLNAPFPLPGQVAPKTARTVPQSGVRRIILLDANGWSMGLLLASLDGFPLRAPYNGEGGRYTSCRYISSWGSLLPTDRCSLRSSFSCHLHHISFTETHASVEE
jgi:hypothetical protein